MKQEGLGEVDKKRVAHVVHARSPFISFFGGRGWCTHDASVEQEDVEA